MLTLKDYLRTAEMHLAYSGSGRRRPMMRAMPRRCPFLFGDRVMHRATPVVFWKLDRQRDGDCLVLAAGGPLRVWWGDLLGGHAWAPRGRKLRGPYRKNKRRAP